MAQSTSTGKEIGLENLKFGLYRDRGFWWTNKCFVRYRRDIRGCKNGVERSDTVF